MIKLSNIIVFDKGSKDFFKEDEYLMVCHKEEHLKRKLKGSDVEIQLVTKGMANNLHKFPTRGRVVKTNRKDSWFKEGDELICKYHTFFNTQGDDKKTLTAVDDDSVKEVDLYLADNTKVIAKIDNGKLIPREGIIISEPLNGNLIDSKLELSGGLKGRRRDVLKVKYVWDGCTEYKEGDYVMVKMGGDYEFYFEGELHLSTDVYRKDIYAKVGDDKWYDDKNNKHVDLRKEVNI